MKHIQPRATNLALVLLGSVFVLLGLGLWCGFGGWRTLRFTRQVAEHL